MRLSAIENTLIHDNNFTILGTSISGVENYVGPMVACSIILDYFALPKNLKKFIDGDKLSDIEFKQFVKELRYIEFYAMEADVINTLKDVELAEHMAKFNCANKLVWRMLQHCEVPDAYITSDKDLTEVIDTTVDSVHSERGDRYVLWNTNHSLELVTPKALFITKPVDKSITTRVAKRFADLLLKNKLSQLDALTGSKYYMSEFPGEKQVQYVAKYGNTINHRVFLPRLTKYPVGQLMWSDK